MPRQTTFHRTKRQAERELARLVAEQEAAPAGIPEEPLAWGPTTTVNYAGHQLFVCFVTVAEVRALLRMNVLAEERAEGLQAGLGDYTLVHVRMPDVVSEWVSLRADVLRYLLYFAYDGPTGGATP